ncbi:MAG: aldehyde dehydrogenase family protein [Betaproteobacteria bacterium]
MHPAEDILALPLWINGRAFLTVTPSFQPVRAAGQGEVLRRIPLCGAAEVSVALQSARAASAAWAALAAPARAALLIALGEALERYAAHFSSMIVAEAGKPETAAATEVEAVVALLRSARETSSSGVVAIVGEIKDPLLGVLSLAVPEWLAGACVVFRSVPSAPSALFALAELSGRCGFPAGVFNVLHGNETVVDELRLSGARLLVA